MHAQKELTLHWLTVSHAAKADTWTVLPLHSKCGRECIVYLKDYVKMIKKSKSNYIFRIEEVNNKPIIAYDYASILVPHFSAWINLNSY